MFIKFARLQEAEADHPTHATLRHTDREELTTGTGGGGGGGGGASDGTGRQGVGIGIVGRRGMGVVYGADGKPVSVCDEEAPGHQDQG